MRIPSWLLMAVAVGFIVYVGVKKRNKTKGFVFGPVPGSLTPGLYKPAAQSGKAAMNAEANPPAPSVGENPVPAGAYGQSWNDGSR